MQILKCLVVDERSGKKYFGTVDSPEPGTESLFGVDHTDMLQVGIGYNRVILPVSAATVHPGKVHIGWFMIDCDAPFNS